MKTISKSLLSLLLLCLLGAAGKGYTSDPVVSNVKVAQRPGTHKVDIRYDVVDADGGVLWIKVEVSDNGGASYVVPAASFSGDFPIGIEPGLGKHIVWDAGVDWGGKYSANMRFRLTADDTLPQNMVWIESGTLTMGSTKVTISRGFGMSKYEVTQAQYKAVMGSSPSRFKGDNKPVEQVSWHDAVSYCAKLTGKEKAAGRLPMGYEYRLPTEAEWEYACRAGTTTLFSFGDDESQLGEYAWYKANSGGTTHPVGQKKSNGWGLYDMHGNVLEWCQDWSGNYPGGSVTDPQGPTTGPQRVRRGGHWYDGARFCRSEHRDGYGPGIRGNRLSVGFRPVLAPTTNP